jgi:membrane peptidoglycan carboxypeptidase
MLEAAMDRQYSGNPEETFFTGGGEHHFVNFEREEDGRSFDLREGFANSVNLVFVRLLRDIVNYTIAQGPVSRQELMDDSEVEARRSYLERFADQEGSAFLHRFISDYENLTPDQVLDKLAGHGHKSATARTIMFRSARPHADFASYTTFMMQHPPSTEIDTAKLMKLYNDYPVERFSLADRAYIAGVNPLELWLCSYLQSNPHATRSAIIEVSRPVRIESYAWLFHPNLKRAQDTRIREILEQDAFAQIQKRWARLGYPFDRLVPSLATAVGSSADRPGALAELVGILLNDGVRLPTARFESLQFGAGTPYQTLLIHDGDKHEQRVLDAAITHVVKEAMIGVVQDGTAKRVKDAYKDPSGQPYVIGGKTGTGDQRYDEFAAGGRLISSRVLNRTGTFVFYIGDRFFGTITAHVAGEDAADYKFTSALSAQMLKGLEPVLGPLINSAPLEAQNLHRP